MSNVNTLLAQRLKKKELSPKMEKMAQQSADGNRTSFAGVFSVSELTENEKGVLEEILQEYATENHNISLDLRSLISITSEVKAINNQAILLHGERIKKAQGILTCYRDGAFSAWLLATYGNRQTPYNFLQYFEFFHALPLLLRPQIELMPKQAIYTLASRDGEFDEKRRIIENYDGQTKEQLLALIRETFPLDDEDRRQESAGDNAVNALKKVQHFLLKRRRALTKRHIKEIQSLIEEIQGLIV